MNHLISNSHFAPFPGELDLVIEHLVELHGLGLACVPICRPTGDSACSAPWHPVPCEAVGKRPLIAGYPAMAEALPPASELVESVVELFPCDLGIVVPRWAVVVEGDSRDGEREIVALAGAAIERAPVRERREGRGRGWLFRIDPESELPKRVHVGTSNAIDILPPGSIFVIPPSVHRTGHRYNWVPARAPWDVPISALPPALYELAMDGAKEVGQRQVDLGCGEFAPRLSSRVAFLIASRSDLARLWRGEGKSHGDTSRSGVDYSVATLLDIAGVPLNEIAEAIAARPGAHRADRNYCVRTALAASRRGP